MIQDLFETKVNEITDSFQNVLNVLKNDDNQYVSMKDLFLDSENIIEKYKHIDNFEEDFELAQLYFDECSDETETESETSVDSSPNVCDFIYKLNIFGFGLCFGLILGQLF